MRPSMRRTLRRTAGTLLAVIVFCAIATPASAAVAPDGPSGPDTLVGVLMAGGAALGLGIVTSDTDPRTKAKALREKAARFVDRMRDLTNDAEEEDRDLTEAEQAKFDKWKTEVESLTNRADRIASIDDFDPSDDPDDGGTPANSNRDLPNNRIEVRDADPGMRGFSNQRDFLTSVTKAYTGGNFDERLKGLAVVNAAGGDEMSSVNDPYGGFFVPESMLPNWLRVEPEPDPMLGRLTNLPMETPLVKVPARVDKNHSSSVSGGLTVTRRIETQSGSSSRMELEKIELNASSLFGLSYVTEELMSDSPRTIAALLSQGFRDEFQSHLIDERINGNGVGEFLGILNSPCKVSVAKEGGQSADTINGTNILKMRSQVWRYSQAVWFANHDCLEQLAATRITGDNGDVFLFNPSRGEDVPDMLFGRPIFFTEYAKTLGDQGDLICGVWSQFLEGTYQPLEGAESVHVRFLQNERTFRFTMRNAGAPWWRSPLTPKNGANQLSPFVVLDERA